MKPRILKTERLVLRSSQPNDVDALFNNYHSDHERSRFLTRKPYTHSDQTRNFLNDWCKNAWSTDATEFSWVIALKENNHAIGIFLVILKEQDAQVHFGISKMYEGQGLITEAGIAVMCWLEKQDQVKTISTICAADNYASIKVLEKLGFENQGILKEWLQFPAFGQTSRDCMKFIKRNLN
jgi:ribosomal-protein-alanine N-acetyltransferase